MRDDMDNVETEQLRRQTETEDIPDKHDISHDISIEDVRELIKQKQYSQIRQVLPGLNVADIAAMLEEFDDSFMLQLFRLLPKTLAADVFSYLPLEEEQFLITSLSDKDAAHILENMMADDATDLLEEMPANIVKRLLANTDKETRRDINHLLKYPDASAGSIMTVEFVDLKESFTVAQAVERIRQIGVDSDNINKCYVLDAQRTLIGTVALRYLLLSPEDSKISDIMQEKVISLNTLMDQEEVAHQFQKYDFTSMPVVDNENRLVGIITVDDVVDVLQEEATEDIEIMAAIVPTDKPYMKMGVFETYRKRIPWLLLLMISATFTAKILSRYETALSTYIVLNNFIPMLMDTGGNAGGQASVTIIRGLSLNEIEFHDIFRIVWKEFRVALICGLTLAAANFVKLLVVDQVGFAVAFVVCATLLATIAIAKMIGCMLPMIAKKLGFDPAVMASPFITTIVDAFSLMVYFQIATAVLHIG